jgi:hypothetical protein
VLEQGFRTPDLARSNAHGFKVLSTKDMGAKVRETVNQLLASSNAHLRNWRRRDGQQ